MSVEEFSRLYGGKRGAAGTSGAEWAVAQARETIRELEKALKSTGEEGKAICKKLEAEGRAEAQTEGWAVAGVGTVSAALAERGLTCGDVGESLGGFFASLLGRPGGAGLLEELEASCGRGIRGDAALGGAVVETAGRLLAAHIIIALIGSGDPEENPQ